MSSALFARLVEQEAIDGPAAYAPADFVADVRNGVWKELAAPQIRINAYRRNLQHAYLELVNNKVNGSTTGLPAGLPPGFPTAFFASSADERPLYRAQLRALNSEIAAALPRTRNKETRAHLEWARDEISKILDPKFAPPSGSGAGTTIRFGFDEHDPLFAPPDQIRTCWPDYVIRP